MQCVQHSHERGGGLSLDVVVVGKTDIFVAGRKEGGTEGGPNSLPQPTKGREGGQFSLTYTARAITPKKKGGRERGEKKSDASHRLAPSHLPFSPALIE